MRLGTPTFFASPAAMRRWLAEHGASTAELWVGYYKVAAGKNRYSFEQRSVALEPAREKLLRADKPAWTFWQAQPPGYRRVATWWVISAKKDDTRDRRLSQLIAHCRAGRRIPQLTPPAKR